MKDNKKNRTELSLADINESSVNVVEVNGEEVLVTKVGEKYCACGNSCTHYGAPLNEGIIRDGRVTCPWHHAEFDLSDGRLLVAPALDNLPTYETEVRDGKLLIGQKSHQEITMPRGSDKRRFLIVGGGAAALSAAQTLREEGFAGGITMVSSDKYPPYDRTVLSKAFLGGDFSMDYLPLRQAEFYRNLKIDLILGDPVVSLDPAAKTAQTASGKSLEADKILLATGSRPRVLDIPGFGGNRCFTLRTRSDGETLLAAVPEVKTALLIGAGFIAMELASALRGRGVEVYVVAPESQPMELVFGEKPAARLRKIHENQGVKFYLGRTVKEINHQNGLIKNPVSDIILDDNTRISADSVIMAAGVQLELGYLEESGLVSNGSVPVDSSLMSKNPDIYAAGDIAEFPWQGELTRIEHWTVALEQGKHAARAMLGSRKPYNRTPFFWTKQYKTVIKFVGSSGRFDEARFYGDVEEGEWLAGYYSKGRLKAAATMGMSEKLAAVAEILERGGTISPIKLESGTFQAE